MQDSSTVCGGGPISLWLHLVIMDRSKCIHENVEGCIPTYPNDTTAVIPTEVQVTSMDVVENLQMSSPVVQSNNYTHHFLPMTISPVYLLHCIACVRPGSYISISNGKHLELPKHDHEIASQLCSCERLKSRGMNTKKLSLYCKQ